MSDSTSKEAESTRRSARIRVRLPVLYVWWEGEQEHTERTYTITVSQFGCSAHSHRNFRPGTRMQVRRGPKTMEGRVVYSLKDHSTNMVEVAVGFEQDASDFWEIKF